MSKVPFLELVKTTTSAVEALTLVQQRGVDLVFLDIQMPDLTSIQFLKLHGGKCKVVLTTAYPEYALEGYEHGVIDYLLKPIALNRFLKAVNKAYVLLSVTKAVQEILQVPQQPFVVVPSNSAVQPDYMFIKGDNKNRFLKINYDEILYVEGLKNYVSLFTPDQRVVTYQTLRDLETQLPRPPFYRVHKSYIVSVDKVRLIDGNQVYIGEQATPIGKTYRDAFLNLIRDSN